MACGLLKYSCLLWILPGDKIVRISDQGAAQITVDSGYTVYEYLLPAQAK